MNPRRPFRGLGSARKTRRTLERGGIGPAAELNQTLGNWPRLEPEDQRRALAAGCSPHRRMAAAGWVECRVEDPRDVGRAIRWLRRAYESAKRVVEREERAES
jgi:hypothetical protein